MAEIVCLYGEILAFCHVPPFTIDNIVIIAISLISRKHYILVKIWG